MQFQDQTLAKNYFILSGTAIPVFVLCFKRRLFLSLEYRPGEIN